MNFYNKSNELEVCLVLFHTCNLKCPFCFQNQSVNEIDLEYIKQIPVRIKDDLLRIIKLKEIKKVVFRIWGGEIFFDELSDSMFDIYQKLVNDLKVLVDIETEFCFTSNYVFKKIHRVKQFLKATKSITATSYDPLFRFHNLEQIELWSKNLALLNPVCISTTLTRPNIEAYLNDPVHFQRTASYPVYTEYYIYSKNFKFFAPTDKNIADFFIHCLKNNYFNIIEVFNLINSKEHYCTCNNSCLYLDGKLSFNCLKRSSNLSLSEFYDEQIPDDERYTQIQLKKALSKKKCYTCVHFSYCRNFCMASMLHKDYDAEQQCAFDIIYRYIHENNLH
jgi:sulfatase maturation enzyme AslB (radical SAM superfamily)